MSTLRVPNASQIFGVNTNDVFNDLIDVGKWPSKSQIKRISRIEVSHGYIMDGFTVTYELVDGSQEKVVHGQTRADNYECIDIKESQFLSGISGETGFVDHVLGPNNLFSFYFLVFDTAEKKLLCYGPYGHTGSKDPTSFSAGGKIFAFSGSASPGSGGANYLQSIGIFRDAPDKLILPDGIFKLISYANLETVATLDKENDALSAVDDTGEPSQIWELISKIDGTYYIRNLKHKTWLARSGVENGAKLIGSTTPAKWALALAPRDIGKEDKKETYHICVPGTNFEIKYEPRRNEMTLSDFMTNNNANQLWIVQPTENSMWNPESLQ